MLKSTTWTAQPPPKLAATWLLHFIHSHTYYTVLEFLFSFPDWTDEAVSSAEILRLIYQGRFLHGNVTLAALGLPTGKTTVMHLVPRESLPEPNSQGNLKPSISVQSDCNVILALKKQSQVASSRGSYQKFNFSSID